MRDQAIVSQTCPLCGSSSYASITRLAGGVVVARCSDCHLIYTPRRASQPESLFDGTSLERLRAYHEPLLEGKFEHYRRRAFSGYLDLIQRYAPGRRLLDVGCADGFFLDEARRAGYQTMGIEPNGPMAAFAREELGLDVRHGRLDQIDLEGAVFDVVTFTDSLEYLPDPRTDLSRLRAHMAPGAVLLVKVPNGDYFNLRHRLHRNGAGMGGAFTPPQRVAHYTISTLRALLASVDLTILEAGGFPPIDSIEWHRLTGLPLVIKAPWYVGFTDRIVRRLLHSGGVLEQRLPGEHNHLSQSLAAVARAG